MKPAVFELINDIDQHTDAIWVNEPEDVFCIKNGVIESGAGIHNQYFTVMVMLSGEVRALGIHIFSDLLEFSRGKDFELSQLCKMAKKMLAVDLGVIGYFGLTEFGSLIERFNNSLDDLENIDEFKLLCEKLFLLSNRYQLWLHQIFPWKLMGLFPKRTTDEIIMDAKRLQDSL